MVGLRISDSLIRLKQFLLIKASLFIWTLTTEGCHDANFVVTGGTPGYRCNKVGMITTVCCLCIYWGACELRLTLYTVQIIVVPYCSINTLRLRQNGCHFPDYIFKWGWWKMDAIFQTTFSNAFFLMKMFEFHFMFHQSLFLSFQLTIFHHWFR